MKKFSLSFILLASLAFATDVPATKAPKAPKVPTLTQKQLDKMAAKWQHVLQLDDWRIYATAVRIDSLHPGVAGESQQDKALQILLLHVLDPRDYAELARREEDVPKAGKEIIEDIEDTVLHELMHLRLAPLRPDVKTQSLDEEMVVVRLTTAFLRKH
jgi:hypothetical protein